MDTDTNRELARLRALASTGFPLAPEEQSRLAELERGTQRVAAPAPQGPATTVAGPTSANEDYLELNTDSFERGGGGAVPPSIPGIYPGVCTGYDRGRDNPDQIFWQLESLPGAKITWRGALVCGSINVADTGRSGAFKIKDVLVALGAKYEVIPGRGVRFSEYKGKQCQVSWEDVHIAKTGKTERRIQDIYPASANIAPAV